MSIHIKSNAEIELMRQAGHKLAVVMKLLEEQVRVGISTLELDQLAENKILELDAQPAFKGYGDRHNPFPATICSSLNGQVVHGIPSASVVLKEGDILKVDIGLEYKGYFADMARTFAIGQVSAEAERLIAATEQAFWSGVRQLRAGVRLSAYSRAAQKVVQDAGFSVVRDLVGHGIGRNLHEAPQISNYYDKNFADPKLQQGMTLAIEPMVNAGGWEVELAADGWAFVTSDGSLSAHYENTILVTEKGVEVLTKM